MLYIQETISKSKNFVNRSDKEVDKLYYKKREKGLSLFQRI